MADRKSIIFYLDTLEQWEMLTNEQAGVLIKALLRYGSTGERLETTDGALLKVFDSIISHIQKR